MVLARVSLQACNARSGQTLTQYFSLSLSLSPSLSLSLSLSRSLCRRATSVRVLTRLYLLHHIQTISQTNLCRNSQDSILSPGMSKMRPQQMKWRVAGQRR